MKMECVGDYQNLTLFPTSVLKDETYTLKKIALSFASKHLLVCFLLLLVVF